MTRILIALGLLAANAAETSAQAYCLPFVKFKGALEERYQETVRATAFMSDRWRMVFLRSDDGSWTMLRVNVQGIACMIAAGKNFEPIKRTEPGLKS